MTLRVTLEIIPFGVEEDKRTIDVFNISNIHQTDFDEFTYRIEENRYHEFREDDVFVSHIRSEGALVLVAKALEGVDNQRKNHP